MMKNILAILVLAVTISLSVTPTVYSTEENGNGESPLEEEPEIDNGDENNESKPQPIDEEPITELQLEPVLYTCPDQRTEVEDLNECPDPPVDDIIIPTETVKDMIQSLVEENGAQAEAEAGVDDDNETNGDNGNGNQTNGDNGNQTNGDKNDIDIDIIIKDIKKHDHDKIKKDSKTSDRDNFPDIDIIGMSIKDSGDATYCLMNIDDDHIQCEDFRVDNDRIDQDIGKIIELDTDKEYDNGNTGSKDVDDAIKAVNDQDFDELNDLDNHEFDVELATVAINANGDGLTCILEDDSDEGKAFCESFTVSGVNGQITELIEMS